MHSQPLLKPPGGEWEGGTQPGHAEHRSPGGTRSWLRTALPHLSRTLSSNHNFSVTTVTMSEKKTCLCLVLHSLIVLCSLCIQVLPVVVNLVFTYSERHFAPPVSVWLSIHSRGGKRVFIEDQGKTFLDLILLLLCCYQFTSIVFRDGRHTASLTFLFWSYIDFNYALIL